MTSGRQPFLQDAVIALHAPTQVWSRDDGDMRAPIDGIYHGDRRLLAAVALRYGPTSAGTAAPEAIAAATPSAQRAVFDAVLRDVDDPAPDPHVRLTRTRDVAPGEVRERIEVRSVVAADVPLTLTVRLTPDFRPLAEVKAGLGVARLWRAVGDRAALRVESDEHVHFELTAPDARTDVDETGITLSWQVVVPPRATVAVEWVVRLHDPALVVTAAPAVAWEPPADTGPDPRLARWLRTALGDLAALRLALPDRPDDVFLAAGAPWFLTLFGRDSLWAARMMLPVDAGLAASTLRVLARLQGVRDDPATEEEPGKIAHELRSATLEMPGEGIVLPPLYYGTVDATALWVCLLAETADAGMPDAEVRELLPALRGALDWIVRSTGDGFLSYIDRTGTGLANQGWKDSGDSIQWRDGALAAGPIALCEVQGYAYEAAVAAATLLDRLGEDGAPALREWAAGLRGRFRERFWVTTAEGRYPAIALDRDGRAVDTLTSNIGHLLGTGILDPDEERAVADLLVAPTMSSGFGVRTLSTRAAGFWPLGYHNGSVWAHDTAIVAHGMHRAGLADHARQVVTQLLDGAEAFAYRVPELYAGDAAPLGSAPAPYPAACRPQAWSAAAAVTCLQIVGG